MQAKRNIAHVLISADYVHLENIRIHSIKLELACSRGSCEGIFSHANIFNDIPRISLDCKLVPVQYREYEYCLFRRGLNDRCLGCI